MYCNRCGKELREGSGLCPDCAPVKKGAAGGKLTGSLVGTVRKTAPRKEDPPSGTLWHAPADLDGTAAANADAERDIWAAEPPAGLPPHARALDGGAANRFNRSPRFQTTLRRETITIRRPPAANGTPEFNWLTILLPPVLMAAVLVVVSVLSGGVSTYLFFMIPMQVISVVVSVVSYLQQKKKHTRLSAKREEVYTAYLQSIREQVAAAADEQRSVLLQENPSAQECVRIAAKRSRSLWERRFDDPDFGAFRIGTGDVPAAVTAVWTRDVLSMTDDPLEEQAECLGAEGKRIADAPVLIGPEDRLVGFVGPKDAANQLAQEVAVQLAALHSYEDLKLCVIFSEADRDGWDWVRWLPHTHSDEDDLRYLAATQAQASILREKLLSVLHARAKNAPHTGYGAAGGRPRYLLIVAAPELLAGNQIYEQLSAPSDPGIRVIFLCRSVAQLPKECSAVVEVAASGGVFYPRDDADRRQTFRRDRFDHAACDGFARALAPLRLSESAEKHTIPNAVSFFEGYRLKRIEDYDLGAAWSSARTDTSLAVPVGVDESGKVFSFDILDGKHGVHGLVGGMPGSGKSEMLQSWILSMAMHFSPQDISFILIDFKGTGLITPFVDLPHLAGTISNIDRDIRRNKEALEYELTRREKLFDQYGVSNIQAYLKKCNSGKIKERLPILFVIIDEFAEFKKTFPEFMKWVESSFAKGRSEGIWFILATQQPGNEASQAIKENSHFKWCLKVASASASKELLGIPDAAQITRPGRAYVRVNNNSSDFLVQVQSFWSGAPYAAGKDYSADRVKLATVDLAGNRRYFSDAAAGQKDRNGTTEIDAAVAYIAQYARKHRIPAAARVWSEPLPARIAVDALLREAGSAFHTEEFSVIVGKVDDPKRQAQYPLAMRFSEQGHIAIYGAPVTGKTTLLKTLVMSAALQYAPQDVNLYLMDLGGMNMRCFAGLPHVGGIVELGDAERIGRLASMLLDEIERRKKLFSAAGVGSIRAYRQECAQSLPYILLVVDQINAAPAAHPALDAFLLALTQSGANYGVYLAATTTGATGIPYKMQPNIKMAYALQMADRADYSGIVGKTNGTTPEDIPGRGLAKHSPALLFQAALPAAGETDAEIDRNIRLQAEHLAERWRGVCARKIPQMPQEIPYGSIESSGIVCGLDTATIEPVCFDHQKQYYLIISGTPHSGKSRTLYMLGRQMKQKLGGTLHLLDVAASAPADLRAEAADHATTAEEIHAFFDRLMPVLRGRSEQPVEERDGFAPIIVLIDDFSAFYSQVNDKTVSRLEAISKLCDGLRVYLLAAGDATALSVFRAKGEPFVTAASTDRQLLLLGGCLNDHGIAQVRLSYSEKSAVVNEREGYVVQGQTARRVQFMLDRSARR